MKLVVDADIPYIQGVFEPFFQFVTYKKGDKISPADVLDADALIVRTRTICNEQLLKKSKVKAIASATIGTDHIDLSYCEKQGIEVYSAPGCNAAAVMQWVISAILSVFDDVDQLYSKKTLGIVGIGNIGKILLNASKLLGFDIMLCDPPRQRNEYLPNFVPFNDIAKRCDIISFHVPLNRKGPDATYRMAGEEFFNHVKPNALILNSSRGGVVDEVALLSAIKKKKLKAALDVWENEPLISKELLENVSIATPHIAGYSLEGKVNATICAVKAISSFFKLPISGWEPKPNPCNQKVELNYDDYIVNNILSINRLLLSVYPIQRDHSKLYNHPSSFEKQRNSYKLRREYSGHRIKLWPFMRNANVLEGLGFNLSNQ